MLETQVKSKPVYKPIVTNIVELRKLCDKVTKDDPIKEIIKDLRDTLAAVGGVGLTANQIGVRKQISVCKLPEYNQQTKKMEMNEFIMLNPKIIEHSNKFINKNEGCLSFPGQTVNTDRWVFITLEYDDEKLEHRTAMFQDLEGVIVQHEQSHCLGRTIFDQKHRDINRRGTRK